MISCDQVSQNFSTFELSLSKILAKDRYDIVIENTEPVYSMIVVDSTFTIPVYIKMD